MAINIDPLPVHEKVSDDQKFELYRTKLAIYLEQQYRVVDGLHKLAFSVSSGAIVVSIGVLNAIEHSLVEATHLYYSWLAFCGVIVFVLLRHAALHDLMREEIKQLGNDYYRQRETISLSPYFSTVVSQLLLFFLLTGGLLMLFKFGLSNQPFRKDAWNELRTQDSLSNAEFNDRARRLQFSMPRDSSRN